MDDYTTKDIVLSYEKNNLNQVKELWDEAFGDPEMFTDYYFENIYRKNRVLSAYYKDELVGMIHLNPYKVLFDKREHECSYIVGVAVKEHMRGKGIMKYMLSNALDDIKDEAPFAFLMPRKQEFYNSSGFSMVYFNRILECSIVDENEFERDITDCYSSLRLHTINLSGLSIDEYDTLACKINDLLASKYVSFSKRSKEYLQSMVKEHLCQHGDVYLVNAISYGDDEEDVCEHPVGLFSCDVYDDVIYVERFETFVDNGFPLLISVLKLAQEISCSRCTITVAEHDIDDIDDVDKLVSGVEVAISDGKGIMAIPFTDKSEDILKTIKGNCFFDEIV